MKHFEKMVTNFRTDVLVWRFVSDFCSQQFACVPICVPNNVIRCYRHCNRALSSIKQLPVLRRQHFLRGISLGNIFGQADHATE